MENTLDNFKKYVLMRRDAFEQAYGLTPYVNSKIKNEMYYYHFPNNLRYLDDISQRLITVVNQRGVPLRDKLITCLVFILIPNETQLNKFSGVNSCFSFEDVYNMRDAYNKGNFRYCYSVSTPIQSIRKSGLKKGDLIFAIVEDFVDKLPKDLFKGWKTSEIYKHFTEWEQCIYINDFIAFQLASCIPYINELNVKIDCVEAVPHRVSNTMKELVRELYGGKKITSDKIALFCADMIKWYHEQAFLDTREKLVTPLDIIHMMFGYKLFLVDSPTFKYWRNTKKTRTGKRNIKGINIVESIYEYYKL